MPKLTITTNYIFQGLATVAQLANQYSDFIPSNYKWLAVASLSIIQGVLAIRAHYVTPAGAPVTKQ